MDTEKALIGSILLDSSKMLDIIKIVSVNDFSSQKAKVIYTTAINLWKEKKTVDMVTVAGSLPDLTLYIAEATSDGSTMGVLDYARTVAENGKRRRINDSAKDIISLDGSKKKLSALYDLYKSEMREEKADPSINEVLKRFTEYANQPKQGLYPGVDFLKDYYIEMEPGHIWVMGAFTSTGKTAMAIHMLCQQIKQKDCPNIVFISTEMTELQLMGRILGNLTGIYSKKIERNDLTREENEKVERMKAFIAKKPVKIYYGTSELSDIEAILLESDLKEGLDICYIDYVQNCHVSGVFDPYIEQRTLAKRFQQLAKDTNSCIVCLSQISNQAAREDGILEYKGAGEWSAVIDLGIKLQRKKGTDDELIFTVAKNRHGEKDIHNLFQYINDFTSFLDRGRIYKN